MDEVRLDAAAARCVVLPELFFAALFPDERAEVFEPPRADERAAEVDFFEAVERDADLPDDFAALFLAVVFLAAVFLAVVFLAAVFLAAVFFAPDFADEAREVVFLAAALEPPFFEAALFVLLAAVFLAAVFEPLFAAVFLAAVFLAPDLADDFVPPFLPLDERRALLFFAGVDVEPPADPALLKLMSLGLDLSSVGMNASFKSLRVHRHACKRQRRYIKRVPINGKCPK